MLLGQNKVVFDPDKFFRLTKYLRAKSLARSTSLAQKCKNLMKNVVSDKHSSLFCVSISEEEKVL
jgi:hypothetical protein